MSKENTIQVISAWEKDPNQGFTEAEIKILAEKGLVKAQVHNII